MIVWGHILFGMHEITWGAHDQETREAEEIKEIGREEKRRKVTGTYSSNTERQEEGAAVWTMQATGMRAGTERWWWE